MNPTYLSWLGAAINLVEQYVAVRTTGGTAQQANAAVIQSGMSIADTLAAALVQHLAQHPAALPTTTVTTGAVTVTTGATPGVAS